MSKPALTLTFLLLLALLSVISQARPFLPLRSDSGSQRPQALESFNPNSTQSQNGASCSFTVSIKTSCSSTTYTRDQISLSFGDAYGNQVYAPRLDDPSTGTFERCSTDTFDIYGPCTYQVCYVYLYRSGYDGWKPQTVTIYGYSTRAVTFYYDTFIPNGVWFGFNYCGSYLESTSSSAV